MKIYLVERTDRVGYDEFDAWVVVAETPEQAVTLCEWGDGEPRPNDVHVEEIEPGISITLDGRITKSNTEILDG